MRTGRLTPRLAPLLMGLVTVTAVGGCVDGGGSLVVLNRTSVPVVLEQATGSTLVVDACAERTIILTHVWGAKVSGSLPYEPVPEDAYAIPLPGEWLDMHGVVTATLLLTNDGVGVSQDGFTPFEATGGGSFPPDPGSETCAGEPPLVPGGWPGASIKDVEPPTSKAGPLDSDTTAAWVAVPCVASDDDEVDFLQLWRRYRPQTGDPWGPWEWVGVQESCPFTIWLDAGEGYYEFATMATDPAGNEESLPAVGDAAVHRGPTVPPSSSPSTGPTPGRT